VSVLRAAITLCALATLTPWHEPSRTLPFLEIHSTVNRTGIGPTSRLASQISPMRGDTGSPGPLLAG
jgi:hypothetical protein